MPSLRRTSIFVRNLNISKARINIISKKYKLISYIVESLEGYPALRKVDPAGRTRSRTCGPLTSRISPASSARRCPPNNSASPSSWRIEVGGGAARFPRATIASALRSSSPPPARVRVVPRENRLTRARHVTVSRAREGWHGWILRFPSSPPPLRRDDRDGSAELARTDRAIDLARARGTGSNARTQAHAGTETERESARGLG